MAAEFRVAHGAIALWEKGERTIPGPILKLLDLYEGGLHLTTEREDSSESLKKLHSSWVSRSLKLSAVMTRVVAKLAKAEFTRDPAETRDSIAGELALSLGELKGPVMKIGQMLSFMDFTLPDSAREILSSLQDSAQPLDPKIARQLVERELGRPLGEVFESWTDRPLATASIGQVHRARLKGGAEVAVKVQYPEIVKSIESDLANVRAIQALLSVFLRGQDRSAFIEELRERLLQECDYLEEARSQEILRKLFQDDERVVIPRTYPELCTRRVLVTEYVEAERFGDFLAHAQEKERNQAAEIIWSFAFRSILRHGVFNADPHPGNYLFRDGKVVFLDFGCVKRFSPEFVDRWKQITRAGLAEDKDRLRRLVTEAGFAPNPGKFDFEYHYSMLRELYRPIVHDAPFRFTRAYVQGIFKRFLADNPNKSRMNVPKDWIFCNRIWLGLFAVLAQMGAEANWHRLAVPLWNSGMQEPSL